jgi:thiol-disulfide isomerase/thioredoxin
VLAAAAGLLLTACSSISGTGDLTYVSGDGQVLQVDPADRAHPVEVSGTTIQGRSLDLADLRGKVVVVNVWWSGCGPCVKEMPMLADAQASLDPKKVAFVGVDIRDVTAANAAAFEKDTGVDYPSLYDPGSEAVLGFGHYQPRSTPATLVLDKEGRVAVLINGPVPSETTLTDLVEELLKEGSGD